MADLTLYHLTFGGALRLGRRGVGLEATDTQLPADTLFAALLATLAELGDDPTQVAEAFPRLEQTDAAPPVPFLLTSAFPFAGEVRFYPAPPLGLWQFQDETIRADRFKELKRIAYVSEAIFSKILAREPLDDWLPPTDEHDKIERGLYLQGRSHWLTLAEVAHLPQAMRQVKRGCKLPEPREPHTMRALKLWQMNKVPRVTVDRIHNASNIFFAARLSFNRGCGLWFGIDWREASWQARIETALGLLADHGLGAERSVGYGHFVCEKKQARKQWPDPAEGGLFITLSRYHPRPTEVDVVFADEQVVYNLISVGGWLHSHSAPAQRRQRLWLVEAGGVLRAPGGGPWGDLVDVRPVYNQEFPSPDGQNPFPHPIWRYGLACPVALGGRS